MKKVICLLLAFVMCLGLCACGETVIVDNVERTVLQGRFIILSEYGYAQYIVFDEETNIVYYLDNDYYAGYLTPYQIYKDGVIYGAVYENGEIVPKPYAFGITFDMLGLDSYLE